MRLPKHLPHAVNAGWNLADQVLSSVTNVAMSILIARNVSAEGFGMFSVAFLIFSLTIGAVRALVAMPLSMRNAGDEGEDRRRTASDSLGASLVMGVVSGGILMVAWPLVGGGLGSTLAALAISLPALMLQDTARYAFLAWAQADLATLNDFVWALVQFLISGILIATGHASTPALVLAWGLGAAVALLVACVQLRSVPDARAFRPWMSRHKDITGYLLGQYAVTQGAAQGGVLLFGGFMGVANIGALRAAQTLTGPLAIVSNATMNFGIPQVARQDRMPRHAISLAAMASTGMFLLGVAYALVLILLPDDVGVAMFGDSWQGASSVLLAVSAAAALSAFKLGPFIFVAGRGMVKRTFPLVVAHAVLLITMMAIGGFLAGIEGLAWGMAAAETAIILPWFLQLRSVMVQLSQEPQAISS